MFKSIMVASLLLIANTAQAGYVATDWLVAGDSRATLQEETGVEWLKLTETTGMSVNQVIAQTGTGGTFEGWRIPTAQEIVDYWAGMFAGSSVLNNPQGSETAYSNYSAQAQQWVALSGAQTTSPIRSYGIGYGLDGDVSFFGLSRTSITTRYRYAAYTYNEDDTSIYMGVFLVSDGGITLSSIDDPSLNVNNANAPINDVPVPFALGAGLLLAGLLLRRKAS